MFSCFDFFIFCEEGGKSSRKHHILYDANGGWMLKIKRETKKINRGKNEKQKMVILIIHNF